MLCPSENITEPILQLWLQCLVFLGSHIKIKKTNECLKLRKENVLICIILQKIGRHLDQAICYSRHFCIILRVLWLCLVFWGREWVGIDLWFISLMPVTLWCFCGDFKLFYALIIATMWMQRWFCFGFDYNRLCEVHSHRHKIGVRFWYSLSGFFARSAFSKYIICLKI